VRQLRQGGSRQIPGRRRPASEPSARLHAGWWRRRAGLILLALLLSIMPVSGTFAQPSAPPGRAPREAPPSIGPDQRRAVAFNRATGRVYVADPRRKALAVRAAEAGPVPSGNRRTRPARPALATVPLDDGPYAIAVDPRRGTIYVVSGGSDSVSVIDGTTDRLVATIPVGRMPVAVAVNPATGRIFIANRDGDSVSVIDGDSRRVVSTVPVGHAPISLLVQQDRTYVAHQASRDVAEISPDGSSVSMLAGGFAGRAVRSQRAAAGVSFAVTSTLDEVDAEPGDGQCRTASAACTLRAAIQETNALPGADAITVPAGTYTLTLPGDSENLGATGDLDLRDDVVITGAGPAGTVIDAAGIDRVLHLDTANAVEISGVTIRGGRSPFAESGCEVGCVRSSRGSGVANDRGNLKLSNSVVTLNLGEETSGGGIYNTGVLTLENTTVSNNQNLFGLGGGIFNWAGSVSLDRVTVDRNSLFMYGSLGGGIYNGGGGSITGVDVTITNNHENQGGGGIYNEGTLTLERAEISQNVADFSSGGGGLANYGTATLRQATIRRNSTYEDNCGRAEGGGIRNLGSLTITDADISENRADQGGGVFGDATYTNVTIAENSVADCAFGPSQGAGVYGGGTFTNVTISGNRAAPDGFGWGVGGGVYGGGIFTNVTIAGNVARSLIEENVVSEEGHGGGIAVTGETVEFRGSILSDNTVIGAGGTAIAENCYGVARSRGNNLDTDGTCALAAAGDLSVSPALLGPLQDNGSPAATHALLAGSPALDNGPGSGCPATDEAVLAPNEGPSGQAEAFVYAPPPGTADVSFIIERVVPQGGAQVSPLVVTDGCGPRQTLAGGGPDAFR
jgi:CSLREA domain-containing protein